MLLKLKLVSSNLFDLIHEEEEKIMNFSFK